MPQPTDHTRLNHNGDNMLGSPAETVPATARARTVAVFTGSFDPPTAYHRAVVQRLLDDGFDEVVVRPEGPRRRAGGPVHAAPIHRAMLADLAFRPLPRVTVDLADLDDRRFTSPAVLDRVYQDRGEVWHVVPAEFLAGGRDRASVVHTTWTAGATAWARSRFVVVHPTDRAPDRSDCPAVCRLAATDGHVPTADIRQMIYAGGCGAADQYLPPAVADYLARHGLFAAALPPAEVRVRLDDPRLLVVHDPRNPKAAEVARRFARSASPDPNLVLVVGGDGTMLRAIREHWRRRLPFVGVNAGHLGHLMNEALADDLAGAELVLHRLPMLRVDYEAQDEVAVGRGLAFGDAWVERDTGQAAWLRVEVTTGEAAPVRTEIPKVVGDGLLVATPAGSSAYARAMGATPVPLNAPVLTLAGSNVFQPRFWKAVALPDQAVVRLTNLDGVGKRPVRGYVDGVPVGRVTWLEARVSAVAGVELAFTPAFDLSAKLLRSLFPPAEDVK